MSIGDFSEALVSLLGRDAPGLSPTTSSRLKKCWEAEYGEWHRRDLSNKKCVCVWANDVYFQAPMEEEEE